MDFLTFEDYLQASLPPSQNISYIDVLGDPIVSKLCNKIQGEQVEHSYHQEKLILIYEGDILIAGFTTLEYQLLLKDNKEAFVTIIDKVDTTGYGKTPKVLKSIIKSYIDFRLYNFKNSIHWIYLFGRAQPQYLFRDSKENMNKKILDDKQLINYWLDVLDSNYYELQIDYNKYFYVPGMTKNEVKPILKKEYKNWNYSTIYNEEDNIDDVIFKLPDDALSRLSSTVYNQNLKVKEFLNVLPFSEECNSSKLVATFFLKNNNLDIKHDKIDREQFMEVIEEFQQNDDKSDVNSINNENEENGSDAEENEKQDEVNGDKEVDEEEEEESNIKDGGEIEEELYSEGEEQLNSSEDENGEDEDNEEELNSEDEESELDVIINIIMNKSNFSSYELALESSKKVKQRLIERQIELNYYKPNSLLKSQNNISNKRELKVNTINTNLIKRKK